jgi:tripartite-type tricarboxylate transporter receptor subunit TctC
MGHGIDRGGMLAKSEPDGSLHMCMKECNGIHGIKMTHVPYKSAVPVMTDLIAGEIHVFCPAVPMLGPYRCQPFEPASC